MYRVANIASQSRSKESHHCLICRDRARFLVDLASSKAVRRSGSTDIQSHPIQVSMSLYIVTMLREKTKYEQNDRGYIKRPIQMRAR
jgi:hypothetical protein